MAFRGTPSSEIALQPVAELPGSTASHAAVVAATDVLPRLELAGVSKRWGKDEPPLLDGLDLVLPRGTQTLVVGQNGVGKTTLLRIASGLLEADSGVVRVDGLTRRSDRGTYQRRIGFVSAGSTGLYARLTVAQHLDLWARLALVPAASRRLRIAAATATFNLAEIVPRRTDRLSMGQRQRVRLAMAFLHGPSVVLLDEPWNSLDEPGVQIVNAAVDGFVRDGGSALICVPTGDNLMLDRADRIYTLEAGRLVSA